MMEVPHSLIVIEPADDLSRLIEAVKKGTDHVIVDMKGWQANKELLKHLKQEVVKHKSEGKSLIFVLNDLDDALLEKASFSITPTLQEAQDLLAMEEIERLI